MAFTPTISKALEIMLYAHRDRTDLGNRPYVFHPINVASQLKDEKEQVVGLLHDVIEDAGISKDYLSLYFDKEIMDALNLLTRNPLEDYEIYIRRLAKNPIARHVKIADLIHNMDITRLSVLTAFDLERLEKYHKAWRYLTDYEKKQN